MQPYAMDLGEHGGGSAQGTQDTCGKKFRRCFKAVDPVSEGKAKFIAIDEQPNHQVVHLFRLGKANRPTHEPLNPGPEIDVLALDFLRIFLAYLMCLGIDMPLVGSPAVRVKTS